MPEGGVPSHNNRNYMQEDQRNTHVREQNRMTLASRAKDAGAGA